jgi:uncharacterized protein YeaO (DUF488 family)
MIKKIQDALVKSSKELELKDLVTKSEKFEEFKEKFQQDKEFQQDKDLVDLVNKTEYKKKESTAN